MMRKFNLKGTVVQRMKGIPHDSSQSGKEEETRNNTENPLSPEFSSEQGLFSCAWRTDVGLVRKNNQDTLILGNGMAGVADGMGGHNGGEIASAGLRDGLLRETKDCRPDTDALDKAVRTVNQELWQQQENDLSLQGMGTTLTVIWPRNHDMIVGQIGDSRAYLLRDGKLMQVTHDHSMVADMVRKGVLTEEQAACHPMRNYITRAVGTDDTVEVDLFREIRKRGDRWLICSDGLYGQMSRGILEELTSLENPEEAADRLMQTALDNGGKDNITLILLTDETGAVCPETEKTAAPADGNGEAEA